MTQNTYNLNQIANELEKTALGISYYGNALYVAKDIQGLNQEDRNLLEAYLTGCEKSTDHIRLQELADKIRSLVDPLTQYYNDRNNSGLASLYRE